MLGRCELEGHVSDGLKIFKSHQILFFTTHKPMLSSVVAKQYSAVDATDEGKSMEDIAKNKTE